jgi:hydrocephalus-inducing protein
MKIKPLEGPIFSITGLKTTSLQTGRIAPGMEAHFVLTFCPTEYQDYSCDIECVTERERFLIAVRAIGPRGNPVTPLICSSVGFS